LVAYYKQSKSLPIKSHGNWPFLTKINATVAYSLGIECAIVLRKVNEAYYKCTKSEHFKIYAIDAMVDQRCCLQNRFIDSKPLTHPHSKYCHGFIWV
jgi:hypothetical protein